MAKPYSDLEKRAIALLANGGNPAQSQDTAVARYWQWYTNPANANHKLPTASKRPNDRKKDAVYLRIFSKDLAVTTFAHVQITKRTNTAMPSGVKTACNYHTLGTNDEGIGLKGFKPAYVYWRTGEATTSADRTSRVTGRTYKSYYAAADQGYLAPFGKYGTDTEGDRQRAIKAAFGATPPNLLTFTREKYRYA